MNVLFLGYWGANEGLSQATINPHLRILSEYSVIEGLFYVTMERHKDFEFIIPTTSKIFHIPYFTGIGLLDKAKDFIKFPFFLKRLIKRKSITLIIARSSLAGGLAYLATKKSKVPFYVESFEPHAEYMKEAGVWKKIGPSYLIQSFLEIKQLNNASGIFPVTNFYQNELSKNYPHQWIKAAPCAVDSVDFQFSKMDRKSIRQEYGIPLGAVVGIYVGKFGGNYLQEESFQLFQICFEQVKNFFLIILSPHDQNQIERQLLKVGIKNKYLVTFTHHKKVAAFLSASDFAFALFKPGLSKKAISPIKVGEYWANGLPVIITHGVGDEDEILDSHAEGGVKFIPVQESMENAAKSITSKINHRKSVSDLSIKYRSFRPIKEIYSQIIESFRER